MLAHEFHRQPQRLGSARHRRPQLRPGLLRKDPARPRRCPGSTWRLPGISGRATSRSRPLPGPGRPRGEPGQGLWAGRGAGSGVHRRGLRRVTWRGRPPEPCESPAECLPPSRGPSPSGSGSPGPALPAPGPRPPRPRSAALRRSPPWPGGDRPALALSAAGVS